MDANGSPSKLPDLLRPGLKLVFVGTAASRISAAKGAYYANPGNRFWRTLHETGITPRQFEPREWRLLGSLGIGFTDLSKQHAGMDHEIPPDGFDLAGFTAKMAVARPAAIAFTSKQGGSLFFGKPTGQISLGRQPVSHGTSVVFVLPSPSGAARPYWRVEPWQALAKWLAAQR